MMSISVTFPRKSLALVRMKEPGKPPEYRSLPLAGPIGENIDELLAFIWAHIDGPCSMQGWLWEA